VIEMAVSEENGLFFRVIEHTSYTTIIWNIEAG
jgi:hypothetical protein